ncbi:hypothetical protein PIB30_047101 [Stylosanthes scabra]|uniref:Glycine-rich protein n=1 Tax=Stylosanthes scabra TaxID=79078 RepID=A0ABU6ZFD9_9FABA|nr:hypothetical protein [Stylosanthes scabra]
MGSKVAILMLGLLAMVLLISSQVAAEVSSNKDEVGNEEVNDLGNAKYGGGYPGYGGGGGYPGGGYPGGGYPGRGGYGGGYCRYGCCGRGYGGRCRCCSSADEAAAVQAQNIPHN